jgi:hypothetical protein
MGKWGSAPYWPGGGDGLPAGTPGALLYYDGTAWVTLPIPSS